MSTRLNVCPACGRCLTEFVADPWYTWVDCGKYCTAWAVALLNVWVVFGECLTALVAADTNVWVDCGRYLTPFVRPLTNVWVVVLDDVPTLTVSVPVWWEILFAAALTKVWAPV